MNALQLAQLDKPDVEGLERSNRRFEKTPVDERSLQNTIGESISANREALVDSAVGSGATARANILANSIIGNKAMSDAYFQMTNQNREENRAAQQFDAGIERVNMQQANMENELNARNKGNFESQKSRLMAALGNDIGGIGREELFKKYPELMGALYNWKGKYTGDTADS